MGLGPYDPNDARDILACQGDFAYPIGILDLDDIAEFLVAFSSSLPSADLAHPAGVYDAADLQAFTTFFSQGCEASPVFDFEVLWTAAGGDYLPLQSVVLVMPESSPGVYPLVLSTFDTLSGAHEMQGQGTFTLQASYLIDAVSTETHVFSDFGVPGGNLEVESSVWTTSSYVTIGASTWTLAGLNYRAVLTATLGSASTTTTFDMFVPLREATNIGLATQFAELYAAADDLTNGIFAGIEGNSDCDADYQHCLEKEMLRYRAALANCHNFWRDCWRGLTTGGILGGGICAFFPPPGLSPLTCGAIGGVIGCGMNYMISTHACVEAVSRAHWTEVQICNLEYQNCVGLDCPYGCP